MSVTEIESKIEKYVEMMEIQNRQLVSSSDAEYRASVFLGACAHLINWRAMYSDLLHGAEARRDVAYKIAILSANAKNVTEAKIIAEASSDYQSVNSEVKQFENKVRYFDTYYQLFTNAHIFFRQMASQIYKETRNGL